MWASSSVGYRAFAGILVGLLSLGCSAESRSGGGGGKTSGDTTATGSDIVPSDCAPTLASDPMNCGAIGKSCLGGSCERCACGPTTLATFEDHAFLPNALALDASRVYVGLGINNPDPGNAVPCGQFPLVVSISRATGAQKIVAPCDATSGGGQSTGPLTIAKGRVYWNQYFDAVPDSGSVGGTLHRASIDGGQVLDTGYVASPRTIVADAERLYFFDGAIEALSLNGGAAQMLSPQVAAALAVDEDHVYALTTTPCTGPKDCSHQGHIDRLTKSDGMVSVVVDHLDLHQTELGVSGGYVYFVLYDGIADVFGIGRAPTNGGPAERFVEIARPTDVRIGARYAYWIGRIETGREAVLFRKRLDGGETEHVADIATCVDASAPGVCTTYGSAITLAIDDTAVVWSDANGAIHLMSQ